MESARPAAAADLPALVDLATAAVDELSANRGGELWRRTQSRAGRVEASLRHDLDDEDALVLAGTLDDVVLGYAVVRRRRLDDGGLLGVVDDLYVHPGARAVGLGEALMDAVLDWCRAGGCIGVDSIALPGDRHTKNFFESFGLVARAIVVHRDLR